ncbi:MAG: phage tail sheath C-terminal domain-containing protein [Candidatus Electrothrix sp. Rat3]|nr:phage tail sheath C-terminal domain-containing protein [Candidatus Electrothrix rattekaaiensis]
MVEYEKYFGEADKETTITVTITTDKDGNESATARITTPSKHIMYYALQLFFANGGGPCYIVSIGKSADTGGISSTELKKGLDVLKKEDEPTLIIFPEAQNISDITEVETLYNSALEQCYQLKDRFVIMDLHEGGENTLNEMVDEFRGKGIGNEYLKYGAVYGPNVETILDLAYDENTTTVTIKSGSVQESETDTASSSTATGDSGDSSGDDGGAAGISAGGGESDSESLNLTTLKENNNFRYELAKAAIRDMPCIMPPAAAIAGIYASVDNSRGVWKAPANVSLNAVIQPTLQISNAEQDGMNEDARSGKSINAIRYFTGKGTLVWGARTLAGNDNEWRYINVRRFFNFAEESIKKATEQFVFEPNDANTWVRIQAMIENFLTTQWRQGALQGVKPEHAFYVAVGLGKTMTAQDILEGKMIIEIGMAVVRPAEFIVLRFSHKMAES